MRGLDHQMTMKGLTAVEVAIAMGKSLPYRQNIANWRKCHSQATYQSIKQVAEVCQCDPIDLIQSPDITGLLRDTIYTLHTYVDEVKQLRLAIAQLDSK
tara:strand:- start:912 stop:1208 length:297 start_codon:yes stop_codon:yes gene_type:complete